MPSLAMTRRGDPPSVYGGFAANHTIGEQLYKH